MSFQSSNKCGSLIFVLTWSHWKSHLQVVLTTVCSQLKSHWLVFKAAWSQRTSYWPVLTSTCSQQKSQWLVLTAACNQRKSHWPVLTATSSQRNAHLSVLTAACSQRKSHWLVLTAFCSQQKLIINNNHRFYIAPFQLFQLLKALHNVLLPQRPLHSRDITSCEPA